jgi:ABC-2 type transport system permease protein
VFGREFADGTLKDLLAVPVQRSSILLAKFSVAAAWCAAMAIMIYVLGMVMGAILRLPGGSPNILLNGSRLAAVTTCLTIAVVLPFALGASVGRGYMLPMGTAVISLLMANLMIIIGWADYFPWAIPLLYAQGESPLAPISYAIVVLTSLAGNYATYLWWRYADQNR